MIAERIEAGLAGAGARLECKSAAGRGLLAQLIRRIALRQDGRRLGGRIMLGRFKVQAVLRRVSGSTNPSLSHANAYLSGSRDAASYQLCR